MDILGKPVFTKERRWKTRYLNILGLGNQITHSSTIKSEKVRFLYHESQGQPQ